MRCIAAVERSDANPAGLSAGVLGNAVVRARAEKGLYANGKRRSGNHALRPNLLAVGDCSRATSRGHGLDQRSSEGHLAAPNFGVNEHFCRWSRTDSPEPERDSCRIQGHERSTDKQFVCSELA